MADPDTSNWMADESAVSLAPPHEPAPAPAASDNAAPVSTGKIADQIAAARNAGYSDADIGSYLRQSPTWGPKFSAAAQAGYSDAEIYGHLGLRFNGKPGVAQSETAENPRDTGWTGALTSGLATAIRNPMQTAQALTTGKPTGEAADIVAAEPITWSDLKNPSTLGKKFVYQFAANAPVMAGGIAGGALGAGLTAETGPGAIGGAALGSAVGATLASAATSLGPDFANELKATPDDPNGAFNRAMIKTGIGATFTGASFAAFGAAPFQSTLKNLMFQAFAVQPGIAATQQAAENVAAGKPVTEGIAEGIPGSVLMTVIPGAAHAVLKARGSAKSTSDAKTAVQENLDKAGGKGDEAGVAGAQAAVAGDVGKGQATDIEGIGRELEAGTRKPTPALDIEGNPLPAEGEAVAPEPPPEPATPQPAPAPEAAPPSAPPPEPVIPPNPAPAPVAPETAATPAGADVPSNQFTNYGPGELTLDPERFQYKASNERGVTGALEGVTRWEPALANPITVWQGNDGKTYVVNGHQRFDLATRAEAAGQTDIKMPAKVFREADGYTPEFMRVLGAYQNIAEGSGTAIDAARVLRGISDIPDAVKLPELPPKQQIVRDGQALVKLSPEAFKMVENEIVPAPFAARVGERISDPKEQIAALGVMAKSPPANIEQARMMVEDIRNSGFLHGEQETLFGTEAFAQNLFAERAQILDNAIKSLARTKSVFKAAVEGEEALTAAGNITSRAGNIEGKTASEQLIDTLRRDGTTRGPISDALTAAARELAEKPKTVAAVSSRFLAAVRKIVGAGKDEGLQHGPGDGGAEHEVEAGIIHDENQTGFLERKPPLPPRQGVDLFGTQRRESTSTAPEPTVRNDQRQLDIPGTEQSAVQAQASRDQAGRGALLPAKDQLPANEGLFGRQEPVQKTLMGNLGDKLREYIASALSKMDIHRSVANYVIENGAKTGHEIVGIYDHETQKPWGAHTDSEPTSVSFPPGFTDAALDPNNNLISHHNHPSSNSFSPADLGSLAFPGHKAIVVHGANGIDYVGSLGPIFERPLTKSLSFSRQVQSFISNASNRAFNTLQKLVREDYKNGVVDQNQINNLYWHSINEGMRKAGIIDYATNKKLSTTEARIVEKWSDAISNSIKEANFYAEHKRANLDRNAYPNGIQGGITEVLDLARRFAGEPTGSKASKTNGESNASGEPSGRLIKGEQGRLLEGFAEEKAPEPPTEEERKANRPYTTPGGQSVLQLPVKERSVIGKIADSIEKVFSPTSRGPLAEQMQYGLRRLGAEQNAARERLHVLDDADHIMSRLPEKEQLEFTHRAETGQKQPTAELEGVAQGIRKVMNEWTGKIQTLGRGIGKQLLKDAKEFYMGRIYANYEEWSRGEAPGTPQQLREQLRKSWAEAQSNKSLTGSANFLKQRSFETLKEAMDAGLVPVTTNPVRMQVLKVLEMQRFYYGTRYAEQLKQSHLARWVPYHLERQAENNGWVKLDDKVFQPKIVTEGNYGSTNIGGWYAPEEAATVFNNYMSKSFLSHMAAVDALRATGNALNLLQLGLSGFHFTFVLGDTMASMTALGMKQLAEGLTKMDPMQMARGAKNVAFGATPGLNLITAVLPTLKRGAQLREWLHMDYDLLPPEGKKTVDLFMTGGGREKMGSFHNAEQQGAFIHNMKDLGRLLTNPGDFGREIKEMFQDHPYTGVFHLMGRLIQNITEPLMGTMVPLAKLGAFRNMAENFERMNPNATSEHRAKAMTEAWDAVDDRLGQMVYDNVFWNKTMKDFAFLSTRSVGWNLGSLRILGGAPLDTARAVTAMMKGQRPEVTQRMSYLMALPMVVAPIGAMLTYMMTGQGPQSTLDYFFPPDGKGGRLSLPSYIKDAFEYAHDPFQTLKNKTHPLLSAGLQLANNQDYYGNPIVGHGENPAVSYADFLLGQAIPFSFRGQQKMANQGASAAEQAASFWGIQPAPGYISHPELAARFEQIAEKKKIKAENKGNVPSTIKNWLNSP